jgi:hypothetical protein
MLLGNAHRGIRIGTAQLNHKLQEDPTMTAVHFRSATIPFPSRSGSVQHGVGTAFFPSHVQRADAALRSFNVGFTNDDHHLFRHEVKITGVFVNLTRVDVTVEYLLRDKSGNIDDPYDGTVDVLVIAECDT